MATLCCSPVTPSRETKYTNPSADPRDERDAFWRGGRRDEANHLEIVGPAVQFNVALGLVGWEVEHQHAVHAGGGAFGQKPLEAEGVHGIQISVEHHGDPQSLLAQAAHAPQHTGNRRAGRQGAPGSRLVDRAVRQRVGKRHAHFQDVHAGGFQRERQPLCLRQGGITGGDVSDEPLLAGGAQTGKGFVDAVGERNGERHGKIDPLDRA